jgi:hypothetical protein
VLEGGAFGDAGVDGPGEAVTGIVSLDLCPRTNCVSTSHIKASMREVVN